MSVKESITIDDAVKMLNQMLAADVGATAALIANRVPCNEALADHKSVQVDMQHGTFFVGLLGVLNGLFGVDKDGRGPITCVFEDDEETPQRKRLVRFERTAPKINEECDNVSEIHIDYRDALYSEERIRAVVNQVLSERDALDRLASLDKPKSYEELKTSRVEALRGMRIRHSIM